ncbi:MAG: Gfo/Idh/MocA family oxidoreductase [Pirellulales bacterium]
MTAPQPAREPAAANRRQFLGGSAAAVLAASTLGAARNAHAAGGDTLRIGLIGCGGRGNGAAVNAMKADSNCKLVAMADLFPDQITAARQSILADAEAQGVKEKFAVTEDRCYSGFDAYLKLIASDVDVVLLTTPPHFRPMHLRAAIEAGKHVFCEKPVAVDAPGVRHVLETVELARQKNLSIVSGLCWRYDYAVRETVKRILDGAIGDIVAIQENYLAGTLWHRGRQPQWSEMEYQLRNWLYFTWLSGDHNVEQHIHSLDKALWLMGDQLPEKCFGLGGRQVRTGPEWGNIYDHHAVCYEYPNGVKVFAYTRQMAGCHTDVDDYVMGTKGKAALLKFQIEGDQSWRYPRRPERPSMYDVEHQELFAGIRKGQIINNGIYMARSTLMAIMGRMACYTGELVTSEAAMNSQQSLTPSSYSWGDVSIPVEVAMPGVTKLV